MTQSVNLGVALGAAKTGLSVGYRLLNLDGTTYAAFTTTNVTETSVAGTYVVTTAVTAPDAGARIVWGPSGTDYVASIIDPVPTVNLVDGAITAAKIASDAITDAKVASDVTIASVTGAVGSVTGNVGGNVVGSVGSLATQAKADVNAEVDTAISDAALATASALATVDSNVDAILADTGTDGVVIATGAITAATIATDAIDADALATDAIAEINATVDTAISDAALATAANLATVDTVVDGIKAVTDNLPDSGALSSLATASALSTLSTKVLKYFQLLFRKDAAIATDNATELTAINADGGSGAGAYANTTDSVEALRDRGDAAWITATGFSTHSAADVWASGTRTLTANTNLNDPTAAAIADAVWDEATTGHTTSGTFGEQLKTDVDAILDDTGTSGVVLANNAITAAKIATDAIDADAIAADAVTEIQSGLATSSALATVDTVVDAILDDTGTSGVVVATASKTGYSLSSAGVQAIWDALTSALTTVGSIGKRLADNIDATISSRSTITTAQVNSEVDTALADYDAPTKAELDAGLAALNDPTAAAIADAVWDEATSGHTTSGTFGEQAKTDIDAILVKVNSIGTTQAITVTSTVSGNTVTVYAKDTWDFSISSDALSLTDYEALAFTVKNPSSAQTDATAILYVRSDTGLQAVGGGTPVSASNGTLTANSATQFTVTVAIAETGVTAGTYKWWLKGFDTTPTPDEGYTLITGTFNITKEGVAAIA